MPGGGIEPPTRGFSIESALNYYLIIVTYRDVILVCVKVCFCFSTGLDQTLCIQPMAGHSV